MSDEVERLREEVRSLREKLKETRETTVPADQAVDHLVSRLKETYWQGQEVMREAARQWLVGNGYPALAAEIANLPTRELGGRKT